MLTQEEIKLKYRQKKAKNSLNTTLAAIVTQQGLIIVLSSLLGFLLMLFAFFASNEYKVNFNDILGEAFNQLKETKATFALVMQMLLYIVALFLPYAFYLSFKKERVRDYISFSLPSLKNLSTAVFISLGFFVIGKYLSTFFMAVLSGLGIAPKELPITYPDGLLNIALYAVMIAVLPPLFEEFAYRGVVMGAFKNKNPYFAVFFSALCFSLMHGTIQQIPYAFTVGLAIGYFVLKYNSIWIGVIIHFLINGSSVLLSAFQKTISEKLLPFFVIGTDVLLIFLSLIFLFAFLSKEKVGFEKKEEYIGIGQIFVTMLKTPMLYVFGVVTLIMIVLNGYMPR